MIIYFLCKVISATVGQIGVIFHIFNYTKMMFGIILCWCYWEWLLFFTLKTSNSHESFFNRSNIKRKKEDRDTDREQKDINKVKPFPSFNVNYNNQTESISKEALNALKLSRRVIFNTYKSEFFARTDSFIWNFEHKITWNFI